MTTFEDLIRVLKFSQKDVAKKAASFREKSIFWFCNVSMPGGVTTFWLLGIWAMVWQPEGRISQTIFISRF